MAQHRGWIALSCRCLAKSQHRRHPSSLVAWSDVADGIDAAVEPVEPAAPHALTHGGGREAAAAQLVNRNRPALSPREFGHPGVRGAFWVHITYKAPRGAD
jgi:hypothetical protein